MNCMDVEQNRLFFNSKAKYWDRLVNHNPDKISLLLDKLPLARDASILDVGTGTGVLIPYLQERIDHRGSITVIDLAEEMIKQARRKYSRYPIRFVIGDAAEYPFSAASFDAIICYSVFPHFAEQQDTLNRLSSLLKKNGCLQVCHSESRAEINRRHCQLGRSLISHGLMPAKEAAALFAAAGLEVLEVIDNDEMYCVLGQRKQ